LLSSFDDGETVPTVLGATYKVVSRSPMTIGEIKKYTDPQSAIPNNLVKFVYYWS
jgi:hypothetical protein